MLRRFLLTLLQRSFFLLLAICLGCSAQSNPANPTSADTAKAIERQVRAYYKLPPDVQVVIGPIQPSNFSNYDAVKLAFLKGTRKDEYEFLLAKDRKTLVKMTTLDLTKDPNEEIHPWAVHAAVNANCLAVQNNDAYWDYADYLHANQHVINAEQGHDAQIGALDRSALLQAQQHNLDNVKLLACMKAQDQSAVRASIKEGDAVGVQATPTLFVNGEEMDGALPIAEIRAVLDRALTQAGVQPPAHPGSTQPESGALAK